MLRLRIYSTLIAVCQPCIHFTKSNTLMLYGRCMTFTLTLIRRESSTLTHWNRRCCCAGGKSNVDFYNDMNRTTHPVFLFAKCETGIYHLPNNYILKSVQLKPQRHKISLISIVGDKHVYTDGWCTEDKLFGVNYGSSRLHAMLGVKLVNYANQFHSSSFLLLVTSNFSSCIIKSLT